jgi:hypothetical protein
MNLSEPVNTVDALSEQISASISRGIDYLYHHQYPNGEFCVYVSGDDAMKGWSQPDSSVFASALIGSCLLFFKDEERAEEMLTKTAAFLRSQMRRGGIWNYFTNYHYLSSLCPSDADDTATIASFLVHRNIDFPRDRNISLLLNNRRKDGAFYTWFTFRPQLTRHKTYIRLVLREFLQPVKMFMFWVKFECKPYDVDAIVNANILYYLGDVEATQPAINWLVKIIAEKKESNCDRWYKNLFTVYYLISRNYYAGIEKLEPIKQPVVERILSKLNSDGSFGECALDTALAVCSLLNVNYTGRELTRAIHFILQSQKETGCWERRCVYHSPRMGVGFGSEELVTAFCLEALERYRVLHNAVLHK